MLSAMESFKPPFKSCLRWLASFSGGDMCCLQSDQKLLGTSSQISGNLEDKSLLGQPRGASNMIYLFFSGSMENSWVFVDLFFPWVVVETVMKGC